MILRAVLIAAVLFALPLGCATQHSAPMTADDGAPGELPFTSPAGEASYHLLMAEIALSRSEWAVSAAEYRQAAQLSEDPQIAERAARVAFDHGLLDDAYVSAKRWAELAPGSSYPRNMLLSLEVARGNRRSAGQYLDALLAQAEAEGWLGDGLSLAAALVAVDENWDVALPLMRRVVSRYDDRADAHGNLASLYLQARRPQDALAEAERAVALEPDWLRAHMLLATTLLELGRMEDALAAAARAAALPSAGPSFRLRHAMLLLSAGRPAEARRLIDALLSDDPNMPGALRQAGLLALREGRLDDARTYFRRLLGVGDQLTAFYLLARTEDLRGDGPLALRLYEQVTAGEYLVPAQVRASQLLLQAGRLEDGLAGLARQAAMHPRHEVAFTEARASLLAAAGREDEALAVYDEAIPRWPQEPALRFARAYLLEQMDRVDAAVAAMEALVQDYPDNADALNALGYTLADRTDRHREAHRYIRAALALEPDNPAIIDSMGWVEYRRGRYDRAISHLERAWSLARDPEIAAHLGEVLWMAGRRDEARAVWRDALSSFPDDEHLNDVIVRFAE